MRVLLVTAHYPPDFVSGATLQVRRIAEHLAGDGHDVVVVSGAIGRGLADGHTEVETVGGVTVHWLGTSTRIDQDVDENWRNEHATALVAQLVADLRPAVVHAHALQTLGADLLAAAADAGVPTVVTMHDFWWWCPRLFLVDRDLQPCPLHTRDSECACARTAAWRRQRAATLRPILDRVDQVLVPSSSVRDVAVLNGLAAGAVDVDENDVDGATVAAPSDAPPGPVVRFLYVGGDHPLKGRDVLLAAADRLADVDGWRLDLYGVPAPRTRWWRRRDRRVVHHPAFEAGGGASVYASADVLVIPSVARESYSLAAREALGSGLAVLTSDCLGPTEVVHDGVNGLVVPIGDPESLATAMRRLVTDPELVKGLRTAARADPPQLRDPAEHATALAVRYGRLGGPG